MNDHVLGVVLLSLVTRYHEAERVSMVADEKAAMKAKINSIWEELKGRDSIPAKVMSLPKVMQKVAKPSNKPSKAVPVRFHFFQVLTLADIFEIKRS